MAARGQHQPRRSGKLRRLFTWRRCRQLSQCLFLLLFLYLFRKTELDSAGPTGKVVSLLFRIDPLAAAAAMLGGRVLIVAFLPALVLLLATVVLGRFFCGWVCPLGTLLDWLARPLAPITRRLQPRLARLAGPLHKLRFLLLALVLAGAIVGLPLVGYLDPFSILIRALTSSVDPALDRVTTAFFGYLYLHAPERVTAVSEPTYSFLRDHVLPFRATVYEFGLLSLAILLLLAALELLTRRFWCRYLCPLGALLGLAGRWPLVRRLPRKLCATCPSGGGCAGVCPMGAFEQDGTRFSPEDCHLCMDCVDHCPQRIPRFSPRQVHTPPAPMQLSRRWFLAALAGTAAAPAIARATGAGGPCMAPDNLLRPPGVEQENQFLDLCVRCGQCLKACPTNGLQAGVLQAGIAGLFAPHLVLRLGYCEYNCTLCSEVCPSSAIPSLPLEVKQKFVIGKAMFDPELCLPWAKDEECLCCEEHCPLPEKAIAFDVVTVTDPDGMQRSLQRPFVHWERCIGCGICENKCPLQVEGKTGIRVLRSEAVPKEPKHRKPGPGHGRGMGRGRGGGSQ